MSPEIGGALIGAASTLVTGAVAAWIVVWQIGEQARIGREQAMHNEGIQLRLSVYREMIAMSDEATTALSAYSAKAATLGVGLGVAAQAAGRGETPWPPMDR